MKKVLILLVLAVFLVIPVSADSQLGISFAPEWMWISKVDGTSYENVGTTRFYLTADGANYFGRNGGFGIEYGLGAVFPLNMWIGDTTINLNGEGTAFAFRVGLGYRHEFNNLIGMVVGLGMNGTFGGGSSYDFGSFNVNYAAELDLGIYGRVAVDLTFIEALRVNVGFAMGGPVYTAVFEESAGQTTSQSTNMSGFFISPFVGISYVY